MVVSTDNGWGFASLLYTLSRVDGQLCWRFFIEQLCWSFLHSAAVLEFPPFGSFMVQLIFTCLLALLVVLACLLLSL